MYNKCYTYYLSNLFYFTHTIILSLINDPIFQEDPRILLEEKMQFKKS